MTMLHPAQYQHAQINRLSLRVYRAAWAVSLPASTKLVLLAICSHINDTTGYANLSVARIAGLCAMHERTTQVHMRKLTALGLLATGRMPGMRVCAYRVNEEALERAQVQPDFAENGAQNLQDLPPMGAEDVQVLSAKGGDSCKKHVEITTQYGKELKEREERSAQPPPSSFLIENIEQPPFQQPAPKASAAAAPAPQGVSADSLDQLNDQRITNGKGRLQTGDIAQLQAQAALAGITAQDAVNWLLASPKRNFFRAEFLTAKDAAAAAPAPAPARLASPAPQVSSLRPVSTEQSAAAASVARAALAALLSSAKAGDSPANVNTGNGPSWAQQAVAKARSGQHVSHAVLKDACKVLRLNPKDVRAAAAAPASQPECAEA